MTKKLKIIEFIGRQLSRLKAGQTYYSMAMYSITAIGILKIAFPRISIWSFMFLIPIMFFSSIFIGYITDKTSITTVGFQKSIEMNHRFLNKADIKHNEFFILQMEVFFEWIKSIKENEPLDSNLLETKVKAYNDKWNYKKEKDK